MIELAHWSALAPILFLLAFRRDAGAAYWLVALAFAVSWFADFGAVLLGGSGALLFVYPALQIGLVGAAFGAPWLLLVLLAVAAVEILGPMDAPVWVTLVGSMAVVWMAADTRLAPTIMVYFGLGTALWLLMAEDVWSERFLAWWYGYQSSRLLAFGLFGRAAWRTT